MSKITVVAQAPYPIPVDDGRHLVPGEIAKVEHTPEVDSQITLGFLRVVPDKIEEPEQPTIRKPRANARDENQETT
jgi:hypothetical protein